MRGDLFIIRPSVTECFHLTVAIIILIRIDMNNVEMTSHDFTEFPECTDQLGILVRKICRHSYIIDDTIEFGGNRNDHYRTIWRLFGEQLG